MKTLKIKELKEKLTNESINYEKVNYLKSENERFKNEIINLTEEKKEYKEYCMQGTDWEIDHYLYRL